MKKLKDRSKKILKGLAAAVVVYSLAGFFLLPYVIKTVLVNKLTENLHRETSVESVYFNPYSFTLIIRGFKLKEPGSQSVFASFDGLRVNLQGRSLVKGGLTVKELTLDRPYAKIIHNRDSSYNFSDLIPKGGTTGAIPEGAAIKPPLKFSFNNIHITNGGVDFDDLPKGKTHTVRDLNAEIPFVSSIPSEVEIFVKPSFSAKVNNTQFDFSGESKPFADSFETSLDINLKDLFLPEYLAYSPVPVKIRMPSGTLTADLGLSYIQYRDRSPELTVKGALKFRDLEFQDSFGERITRMPALDIDIASVGVFAGKAHISSVVFDRPELALIRNRDKSINLMSFVPGVKGAKPAAEKKGPAAPFALEIDSIEVNKALLSFSDLARPTPFRKAFDQVDIKLKGFGTSAGKRSTLLLDFRNPSGERISADGTLSVNPVEAQIKLEAKALDIRPVQAYLDDILKITIAKGRASASGTVAAGYGANGLRLSYRGSSALSGFSTIDKLNREEFLGWDSLALNGLEFDLTPVRLAVKSAALTNFYSNIVVGRDGRLNIREVMARPSEAQGPGARASSPPGARKAADVRIDSTTLKGAKVDFRDLRIKPVFSAGLAELGGRVKGLYLNGSKLAEVSLSGKIDRYAPFEVTGSLNPKKDDIFVDMRLQLNGFDLSSLTPYSGRYIGYGIEKGKIFLDLSYFIKDRRLKAENGVLIDQINLGERVESPQATKLPVSFAISLLRNRRGEIKINLPLSGSIDAPDFSVAGLVIQAIVNLLEKAITSPFALLGSIFGGGEELGYVEFAPGSYSITDANAKKLDILAAALYDRPGLKLDIEGFVSAGEDRESLREYKFMKALKAEKLGEIVKKRGKIVPVDEVVIAKDEYDRFLWLAYKNADFPKEKTLIWLTKKLPVPELERLLKEHTEVTDDDMRELATRRANSVKDYILGSGKVEPSKVFIRWPKTLTPEKKEGLKASRVEFKLE